MNTRIVQYSRRVPMAAGLILSLVSSVHAQESRGTLLGRVTDPSGGVLAGVTVEAVNVATGVPVAAQTNTEGNYRIPYLIAGEYRVSFTFSGFKKLVREKVDVRVADLLTLDATMQLGEVSQAVTVEDTAPVLDTATASLGQIVDRRRLEDLPFREGNPHELMKLAPGVSTHTHLRLNKPGMTGGLSENSVDGSNMRRSEYSLDGIPNTAGDRVAYSPPSAAVQEFKIHTSTYDASLGNTAGGSVNLVTRSGSNDMHGDAWYFKRNSRWDSPDFLQKTRNQPKPKYDDNRYGAALGGRIIRDKAHYFVSGEANPYELPYSYSMTVPTAKMRQGDFSEMTTTARIYDPLTGRLDAQGRINRDPFPTNVLPPSRLNPISLKLVNLLPMPNGPGLSNNYQHPNPVETHDWKTIMARVDYAFTQNNRAFFRYSTARWNYHDPDFQNNGIGSGHTTARNLQTFAMDDTHVLSPNLVLNVRFGYTYQHDLFDLVSSGLNVSEYGFGSAYTKLSSTPDRPVFPNVTVDAWNAYRQQWGAGNSQDNKDTVYSWAGTLNYMRGKHSVAFGSEFRRYIEYRLDDARARSPQLQFSNGWTVGPQNTSAGVRELHSQATFLLGFPTDGNMSVVPSRQEFSPRTAFFVQEDWRIHPKLMLNLGLRWEIESPVTEINNAAINGLDLTTALPFEAEARAAYARRPIPELAPADFRVRGGMLFAGVGGRPRGLFDRRWRNFMPRAGFAFTLNPKTVLSGGYGRFYDTLGVTRADAIQTGYSRQTRLQTSTDGVTPRIGAFADPFPAGLLQPAGNSLGLMTDVGNSASSPYAPAVSTPYAERLSFGIQRQLPMAFVIKSTFVASYGNDLPVSKEMNYTPIEYMSKSLTRDTGVIEYLGAQFPNPLYGIIPSGTGIGNSPNLSRSQLLRPYPHFGSVRWTETTGRSWYNALQTGLERRMAQGFTLNLSYTFSKAMEQVAYRDAFESGPEKRLSGSDRPHVIQVNGIYEVPFGRGRTWGRNWSRPIDYALGGWQVSAMYRSEAGYPLGLGNIVLQPGATFNDLKLPDGEQTWNRVFNTNAFVRASTLQPANNVRIYSSRTSAVRVDGFDQFDMVLAKKFAITERMSFQLRAEAYNLFNSVNLRDLNMSVTDSAFGQYRAVNGYARQFQLSMKFQF